MKNFKSIIVMVTISMGLMSCSSEEIFTPEDTTNKLLENYTVKRDATGAYSLDYNLGNNAEASLSKDKRSNSNDFYLYSSDNQSEKKFKEALALQGDGLKVGFTDMENGTKSSMTILDNDVQFSRDADEEFLVDYSVTNNGDGSVSLNFNVESNIVVNFVYNGDTNAYEVHMHEGTNNQVSYNQTYAKEDGVPLNIEFISFADDNTSRDESANLVQISDRPKVIID